MSSLAYCRQKLAERGLDVSRMSDAAVVMRWTGKQYYPGQQGMSEAPIPKRSEPLTALERHKLEHFGPSTRAVYNAIRRQALEGTYALSYEEMESQLAISWTQMDRAIKTLCRARLLVQRLDLKEMSRPMCYEL